MLKYLVLGAVAALVVPRRLVLIAPATAATGDELKSLLKDELTPKEPPKAAKKVAVPETEFSFGNFAENAKAAGRARAEARRAAPLLTKTAPEPESDAGAVYTQLRAKRIAQKEAATAKAAEKKKNRLPIEEFKAR